MNRDTRDGNTISTSLPSLFRGLYSRVAEKLGIDPSYVSRVARGERNSEEISHALEDEIRRVSIIASRDGHVIRNGHAGRGAHAKKKLVKAGKSR
jgi:hypothetical protein